MGGKKAEAPAGLGVGEEMEMGGDCLVDFFLPRCRSLSMAEVRVGQSEQVDGWMPVLWFFVVPYIM